MPKYEKPGPVGRGSHINPANRFEPLRYEAEPEDGTDELNSENPRTQYIPDQSRSIVSENDSPDVGFRYSINPYRGCAHGCSYCFARPTHEYLGYSAGLDFETKVLVKESAPELFREFLTRPNWKPEPIALSGVTDCYQPAERRFRLTRGCLEVAAEACQPMGIVTKNALVLRDLDILEPMAAQNLVHVNVSLTTLDAELARSMEPRTSTPAARLRAIRSLTDAAVPVRVLVAPIIPGLNDSEIPAILEAAKAAGARSAAYVLLRLPLTVAPVFLEWLERVFPERRQRIEGRIRETREGQLYKAEFGDRMRGSGEIADQIREVFRLFAKRHGLDGRLPDYDCTRFRPPTAKSGQRWLF